jgi:hypothetical protein
METDLENKSRGTKVRVISRGDDSVLETSLQ